MVEEVKYSDIEEIREFRREIKHKLIVSHFIGMFNSIFLMLTVYNYYNSSYGYSLLFFVLFVNTFPIKQLLGVLRK